MYPKTHNEQMKNRLVFPGESGKNHFDIFCSVHVHDLREHYNLSSGHWQLWGRTIAWRISGRIVSAQPWTGYMSSMVAYLKPRKARSCSRSLLPLAAFQWIVEPGGRWYLELFGHVIDGGQRPLFVVVRKSAFQLEKASAARRGPAPVVCADLKAASRCRSGSRTERVHCSSTVSSVRGVLARCQGAFYTN